MANPSKQPKLALARFVLAVVAAFLVFPGAATAGRTLKRVEAAGLAEGAAPISDSVLSPRFAYASPVRAQPASFIADGATVTVDVSNAYRPDSASVRRLVDFIATLVHGPELGRLSLSVRTPLEVAGICGVGMEACYSPTGMRMIIPGEDLAGVPLEQLIAHEYGHHIAANRRNPPWDAFWWGPKRWATHEHVCAGVTRGRLFPGDEDAHYTANPGEGFAEAYRAVNAAAAQTPWIGADWVVDRSFFPDTDAVRLIRQDVLRPWSHTTTVRRQIAFKHPGTRRIRIRTPWDGRLSARASGPGPARVRVLARSGRRSVHGVVCGQRAVRVSLTAPRAGSYRLVVERP